MLKRWVFFSLDTEGIENHGSGISDLALYLFCSAAEIRPDLF